MSSANEGGAGARGIRYVGSAAGVSGGGRDVLRECAVVIGGEIDTIEDGRDGNSCESLSEAPEVFLRVRGGRAWGPTVGEPARRAAGTSSSEDCLLVFGEPTCSGNGTPAMVSRLRGSHAPSPVSVVEVDVCQSSSVDTTTTMTKARPTYYGSCLQCRYKYPAQGQIARNLVHLPAAEERLAVYAFRSSASPSSPLRQSHGLEADCGFESEHSTWWLLTGGSECGGDKLLTGGLAHAEQSARLAEARHDQLD